MPVFGHLSPRSQGMYGANIFRRGLDFLRRNTGRLLRTGISILPRLVDRLVTAGTERGHIDPSHARIYQRLRQYSRQVPSLNPIIDRIDQRLNRDVQRPLDRTDATLDDLADRGLRAIERAVVEAPEVQQQVQEGGRLCKPKPKPKPKKTASKGKGQAKDSKEKGKAKSKSKARIKVPENMNSKEYRTMIRELIKIPENMNSKEYRAMIRKLIKGGSIDVHTLT